MANYYIKFSSILPINSKKELDWCRDRLKKISDARYDDGDCEDGDYDYQIIDTPRHTMEAGKCGAVYFYTEDSGTPDHVANFVQAFFKKFNKKSAWSMQWSIGCDSPRPNSFGGGAVVVSANEQRWISTHAWVEETMTKMLKKK